MLPATFFVPPHADTRLLDIVLTKTMVVGKHVIAQSYRRNLCANIQHSRTMSSNSMKYSGN